MVRDILNVAFYIALQCNTTGIAWGGTGVAKSEFIEALAKSLGYKFFCFIPSMHMPEDIGGMPSLNLAAKVAEMIPMAWIRALTEPKWLLLIDEVTTAPSAMRPPMLTVMHQKRIGDMRFHPTTIVCGAANPPELAPNSSPLEASMLNRCYHHQWKLPFDSWLEGMMNGGKFPEPKNIPVVGDYSLHLPKYTRLVGMFCKAQPAMRETRVIPENEFAFPSIRQWYNYANCLAGAEKVGAGAEVMEELGLGLVGSAATQQFTDWMWRDDLYDANLVVDGKEAVEYGEDRLDQLVYLPVAMIEALKSNPAEKRITKACEVMIEMAEHDMLDLVMPALGEVSDLFPAYEIPAKLESRYGRLLSQLGGA
jgi:hypothetical protein